jgi:hypothetical protein
MPPVGGGRRVGRRAQNDDEGVMPLASASPYLDIGPLLHEALGQVPGGHCRPVVGVCVRGVVVWRVGRWWDGGQE